MAFLGLIGGILALFRDLIGVPFEYDGRGPDQYDCYGLVRKILSDAGIDIPDYRSPSDGPKIAAMMACELKLWKKTELKRGVVILFRMARTTHVGYYMGDDKFIHTTEATGGVTIERLSVWAGKVMGYYEYVG